MYILENNKVFFCVIKLFLVYLVPDGSDIINFVESSITLEAYLSDTTEPGTWGTHHELQAIASLLNVALCIITNREEQKKCNDLDLSPMEGHYFMCLYDIATVGSEMEFHFY